MKLLVLGARGQVGRELCRLGWPAGYSIAGFDRDRVDITRRQAVFEAMARERPDIVINAAAYTAVDRAESEAEAAWAGNCTGPANLAAACADVGISLIHISTDYVFDGRSHLPYRPDALVAPLNVYGATKLEGERRVLAAAPASVIVRTAWVHSGGGNNFVRTAVRLLSAGTPMRVVDDQIGTPTQARSLARALWQIADRRDLRGLLHFTDAGVASWFDVATTVFDTVQKAGRVGAGASVAPIGSDQFRTAARRPHFSVLDKHESWDAIGFLPPQWAVGIIESTHELINA
jgi:dTDP-4-dehydrorhamnose reductase